MGPVEQREQATWLEILADLQTPAEAGRREAGRRDIGRRDAALAWLHRAAQSGELDAPECRRRLDEIYRASCDPGLSAGIKRVLNRIRGRGLLGRDLLRLSVPPAGNSKERALWEDLQGLKQVHDREQPAESSAKSLEERFEIGEQIGEGGMSRVFRAVRREDGLVVAIKYLRPEFFSTPAVVERFRRECQLSLSFDHPHIVRTIEAGEHGGAAFMVMEYLPGGGVEALLPSPQFGPVEALTVIRQTAAALAYLHGRGIVHRDVKPANLLLAGEGLHIKLTDFGLSKDLSDIGLTRIGARMGTDFYVAPEQIENSSEVDQRADIYSLGVCLYRLLAKNIYPVGDYPDLRELHPEAPPELDDLVSRCLRNNPAQRLPSLSMFLAEIDKVQHNWLK